MTAINLATYTNLSKYGIFANNITNTGTINNTGSTIVNNGFWYAHICL
jgi:hypothetical protein